MQKYIVFQKSDRNRHFSKEILHLLAFENFSLWSTWMFAKSFLSSLVSKQCAKNTAAHLSRGQENATQLQGHGIHYLTLGTDFAAVWRPLQLEKFADVVTKAPGSCFCRQPAKLGVTQRTWENHSCSDHWTACWVRIWLFFKACNWESQF